MLACALAGPTVEQQGEMARSGGRMLATLEPEQVRRSLTVWEVSEQSVLYILVYGQVCWPHLFLVLAELSELILCSPLKSAFLSPWFDQRQD